jgi:PST family polysaccharide transporter
LLVTTLTNFIADCGLAWGLVQEREINNETIRFTFTWQLITGSLATILLFNFAGEIASYFKEARAEHVIEWLSLSCVINSATTTATNLLRRNLDFKWINIVQVVSYVVGYIGVGIPVAIYGGGALSLVAAWLVQALCALVMTYLRCRHALRPLFWFAGAASLRQIGVAVFGTNLCNWLLTNLDRMVIARFLNVHAVGVYTAGYNLANIPNNLFISALQPAFLAAGARMQDDVLRLKETYLSIMASIWVLIAPLFMMFAALAPDVILAIYGDKWTEAGSVLRLLALAMPAYISWAMSTPVLWNTGRKQWESLLQLPVIALGGVLFYLYSYHGPQIVAVIAAFVFVLRAVIMAIAACSRLQIRVRDLAPYAWRGLLICSLSGGSAIVVSNMLHDTPLPPIVRVILAGGAGLMIMASVSWLVPDILGHRVRLMLSKFVPSLGPTVPPVSVPG